MKNKKIALLMILIFIVSMTITSMAQEEITKDGLTASEMLLTVNDAFNNQYTTFKFNGTMNMNTKTTGSMMIKKPDPNNEGQFIKEEQKLDQNVDMTMVQEGIFEKPEKVYVKTTASIKNMPKEQKPQSSEVLMDQGVMYMRARENAKWIRLDINPMMQEMKKMMGNDGTNMGMTKEQMELFGMYAAYDENTVIDGKEYYVINVNMDSAALKEVYSKLIDQMFDQLGKIIEQTEITKPKQAEAKIETTEIKPEQIEEKPEMNKEVFKQKMQELFSKMNMNVTYKYYINKETKMYEFMDITQTIDMTMEKIHTQTTSTGKYKYYDFNGEVTFPVINTENPQDMNQLQ
ncbi:hypothetical protein [Crassaminicella profunda]|uniref:hypothetical protein n=1 Tax=Crassaminicella profunda TaxID=1286698 RepID=UPI001CA731E0|nr:hypothetical protein [Crassaminicella profunda]QZY55079.1 hypothetical protein K7H06_19085 [Crassaminicella profunda]